MDELLALLGQHWRLLALYPGGLTTLGALAAAAVVSGGVELERRLDGVEVGVAAAWLTLAALLPLPGAGWPYDIDLITALLALEIPYLLLVRSRSESAAEQGAAVLAVYPLLALAAAMLGQAAGSWVLHDINRSTGMLHWAGLVAWSLALPPLLGLGPWRAGQAGVLVTVRRVAHLALLISAAVPANDGSWRLGALAAYAALLLPLAALDRRWRADPWHTLRWQPWLCLALLALLAALSLQRYLERL